MDSWFLKLTCILGVILQLITETVGLQCKTGTEAGSLSRFTYKQCSFSCCGEEGDQYCCVVSKTVIIGCSIGGVFLLIVIGGAVCYLLSSRRKKRYQESVRRSRPRSVSMISTSSVGSIDGAYPADPLRRFSSLEVRRFSQLSAVSIPANISHGHQAKGKKHKTPRRPSHHMGALAMTAVPESADDDGVQNGGFHVA